MSWPEYLSRLLQATTKVEQAAVFNLKGQPLAASDNLQVTETDGRALLQCLKDPACTLTRLTIDEADFRCFKGSDHALVGKAVNNKERVLVARLAEDVLVLVIGSSKGQGSFLFEVKRSLIERQQRLLAPQQPAAGGGGQQQVQQGQGQQKLVLPPSGGGSVSQEEVLVQLHD